MNKLAVLALVLVAACSAPKNAEPQFVSTVHIFNKNDIGYKVRMNFVTFESDVDQHPETNKQFQRALDTWADRLPLEAALFQEGHMTVLTLLVGTDIDVSLDPHNIKVRFTNIHAPPYSMPDDNVGAFNHHTKELILDDILEKDPDMAYAVSLHELGHVFGLPHIIGQKEFFGMTGNIVLSENMNPKSYLMYPEVSEENKCGNISNLEVDLATKYILQLTDGGF